MQGVFRLRDFEATLPSPGGAFKITQHGVKWVAAEEENPPYVWGFPSLGLAEMYFTQVLKTIKLAQEANRHDAKR
jgi:hypothetical protein